MKILFFITGFRQLKEYDYQAFFLKRCSLINVIADVIYYCNNSEISPEILDFYRKIPLKNKELIITTKNTGGYRMGPFEGVADNFSKFGDYDYVIHSHPDVFIINEQPFIEMLMNNMLNSTTFFVNWSFPQDKTFFSTDLFIFKPKQLKTNIFLDELYTYTDIGEHWLRHIILKNNVSYEIIPRFENNFWHPRRIDMLGFWHEHELERIEDYIKSKT